MNKRAVLISGAVFAGLAVALGAFGSHALKEILANTGRTDTYETAVRYHMYHALALLLVGSLVKSDSSKKLSWAAIFFVCGILLFSGSLYVLCINPFPGIVYLTPIGGVFFIAGWILMALNFITSTQNQ